MQRYIRVMKMGLIAQRISALLLVLAASAAFPVVVRSQSSSSPRDMDWPVYGGPQNQHYSPLAQINRSNVAQLQIAWSFDVGETGGLQTSPIVVNGVLYGITPSQK